LKENKIIQHFKNYDIFTNKDVFEFYRTDEKKLSKSTVNWRIYDLIQSGLISRIGRGKFKVGSSNKFRPTLNKKELAIGHHIRKHFPFIDYCIWNSTIINEFSRHQSFNDFIIIETERDVLDAVFYALKEKYRKVYLQPKRDIVEHYLLEMSNVIIIQHLVSEAHIQNIEKIPTITIEKLLVDIVFGKELFYFYQGYELVNIFNQAFDKYTINTSTLVRYASRRKRKQEIIKLLKSINRY